MCGTILWIGKEICVSSQASGETPCIDDHRLKKDEFDVFGELASVTSQISLVMLVIKLTTTTLLLQATRNILKSTSGGLVHGGVFLKNRSVGFRKGPIQ